MAAKYEGFDVTGHVEQVALALDLDLDQAETYCHRILETSPKDGMFTEEQVASIKEQARDMLDLITVERNRPEEGAEPIFAGFDIVGYVLAGIKDRRMNREKAMRYCQTLINENPPPGFLTEEQLAQTRKEAAEILAMYEADPEYGKLPEESHAFYVGEPGNA